MAKRRTGFGTIALGALTVLAAALWVPPAALAMQTSQCGFVCAEGASEGGTCSSVHFVCQTTSIAPVGGFHPVPKPKTPPVRNNAFGGNRLTGGGNNLTANKIPGAPLTAGAASTASLLKKH